MEIIITSTAQKRFDKLDSKTKARVANAIKRLPNGDIKKLTGLKNDYRLRVGNYRILYSMENDIIIVKNILPRGQAYK